MSALVVGALLVALGWATWKKPRFTASVIWALTATLLGTAAAALLLPTDLKLTLIWLSVATPLVWLACIFWCHWDQRPRRPAAGLVLVTLVSAVVVYRVPPPTG